MDFESIVSLATSVMDGKCSHHLPRGSSTSKNNELFNQPLVCACVCISVHVCAFGSVCLCLCVSVCVCLCVSVCVCLCLCLSVCACVCVRARAHICVWLYVCMRVFVCVCVFVLHGTFIKSLAATSLDQLLPKSHIIGLFLEFIHVIEYQLSATKSSQLV